MKNFIETNKSEFKRQLSNDIEKEIVSFLNTPGGGTIYLGIDDDGSIVGLNNTDQVFKSLSDIIFNNILPDPHEFIELKYEMIENKGIIKIEILFGNNLYYIKKYGRSAKGCYYRVGTTCRSLTEKEIEQKMFKFLNHPTIFQKRSLRQNLSFETLKQMFRSRNLYINEETFNSNNSFLTIEGEFNYYANLLDDYSDISLKVSRFSGRDKSEFINRKEFGFKCLISGYCCVLNYIDAINEIYVDTKAIIRKEKTMFSFNAFKEAWMNAVVHNDYSKGVAPSVDIYSDRIEIVSYGGLTKELSIEEFFSGKSVPVNEPLAKLFMKLGIMEQNGHGVPTIIREYGKEAFIITDNFLTVVIPLDKKGFND